MRSACEQVVGRVEQGLDSVVEGGAEAVRAALQAATARLEATHGVVTVAGGAAGPLSLSGLIAQLSGRANLDDHDDSVLELGVRRLTEAAAPGRRTVMVLESGLGLQRSAFRFLRQVGRLAPELTYVIAAFPEMRSLLAEPGMEALRERLASATVVAEGPEEAGGAEGLHSSTAETAVMAAVAIPAGWRDLRAAPLSARAEGRRRHALWAATAMGMAASVTVGVWLGARTSGTAPGSPAYQAVTGEVGPESVGPGSVGRRPVIAMAPTVAATPMPALASTLAPAQVPAPASTPLMAASGPPPAAGRVAAPGVAARPGAEVAKSMAPEMATVAEAPKVAGAVAEASLAQDGRDLVLGRVAAGAEEGALAPRDADGKPRAVGAARPTRLAPAPSPAPVLAQAAEPRRVMSPKPQRLAALPMAPESRAFEGRAPERRRRWSREERLDEEAASEASSEASREAPMYPDDPARADEAYAPSVRYRRYDMSPAPAMAPAMAPAWRGERALAPAEGPYIGTYEPGPFGGRVFRYEP